MIISDDFQKKINPPRIELIFQPEVGVKDINDKTEDKHEEKHIRKEVELKNNLPFSSISIMNKIEDESEEETSESDEENVDESLNGFFSHFYPNSIPRKKINKCKSFYIKLKRAYGYTKKNSIISVAGWNCCSKKKKLPTFAEKALTKFD